MQCMCGFSTPYLTLSTINASIEVEPCFTLKKQIAQHLNPFLWKNLVVDYRITVQLVANKTEARQRACAERFGKCWKRLSRRGVSLLYICFSIYTFMIFGLRLTRYILYMCRLLFAHTVYLCFSMILTMRSDCFAKQQ
jgi:hypothetical protein